MQSLCPLNSCTSVPLQLAYATPDWLRNHEEDRPLFEPPKNLEAWLQALENYFPDRRIRVQVSVYPGDPDSPSNGIHLDRRKLICCLRQVAEILGTQIPERKRGFYDTIARLHREGNSIECQTRIVPRVLTGPGVRLLKRLDVTQDQHRASGLLHDFWSHELPWLRKSGIQVLEIRSNLNHLLWH